MGRATSTPTISDVARAAGVSKGLVSLALNARTGVKDETRERILDEAKRLGWTPSVHARSLSTRRAYALGLVIARDPGIIAADPFFPAFIAGVEDVLAPAGNVLVLASVSPGDEEAEAYRRLARDRRVDGVFLSDLRDNDERIDFVAQLGLRAVTLGHPRAASPFPAVSVDDEAGITSAVEHLVSLGHTRIAHVAGPDHMLHARRRRAAFEHAMERAALRPVGIRETDFSAAEGAAATRSLLEESKPSAIVFANDPMAIAGMAAARRAGREIPRDLSITGFDNTDIAEHVFPSLTSVATDAVSWGRAAAHSLLAAVTDGEAADTDLPRARLVIRESTGAPRDPNTGDARSATPT